MTLNEKTAQLVMEKALSSGGDFAEIYMEDEITHDVRMLGQDVEDAAYSRFHGAGIRVLSGDQYAYAYTADTSEEGLLKAAAQAAAGLKADAVLRPAAFAPTHFENGVKIPFSAIDNKKRIDILSLGARAAAAYSNEIAQVSTSFMDTQKEVLICNSEGLWVQDSRPRTQMVIQAIASNGTEAQTGRVRPGRTMGFEVYSELFDIEAEARAAAKQAVTMLHAPECPSGVMPVVMAGGFGGVIFHEACGHSLESSSVSRGNSEFCGKLGQVVATPVVTAIDDGTMPGEWGSLHVDDEGTPTQRNVLIENGVLKSYMVDRLGSRRMGLPMTGSCRRQNYTFIPTSRMTNTFIAPGTDDDEEMIRTMGTGLYAAAMGGGSVNPITGEFNFNVMEGYLVRDGKIVSPVRGATLIGKGSEILMQIDRVGRSMSMAQGMCGASSGSIPTNVGQPQIRVRQITVGGKGGALA